MKNCLIMLADGFEETEAVSPHDILTRSGQVKVTYVSITPKFEVESSMGIKIIVPLLLKETKPEEWDFLIIPGGKRGVQNIKSSIQAIDFIKAFHDLRRPIYSICAAPSILGELGYLDGKKYTCFPGFEEGKGQYVDEGVVNDHGLITGHSMLYSIAFGEAILEKEVGKSSVEAIFHGTRGANLH